MPFMTTPERIGRQEGLLEGLEAFLKFKFGAAGWRSCQSFGNCGP